jgi:hypothetical protein
MQCVLLYIIYKRRSEYVSKSMYKPHYFETRSDQCWANHVIADLLLHPAAFHRYLSPCFSRVKHHLLQSFLTVTHRQWWIHCVLLQKPNLKASSVCWGRFPGHPSTWIDAFYVSLWQHPFCNIPRATFQSFGELDVQMESWRQFTVCRSRTFRWNRPTYCFR